MSLERCEWLERKGVVDIGSYDYIGQSETSVYLVHKILGLKISREKDMVGEKF